MAADEINIADLAIIIDETGSMGSLIGSAQRNIVSMVSELSKQANIKMRFGLVGFRDHPPEETSFVYHCVDFTSDSKAFQASISKLSAHGGGDAAEAVLDGVN